MSIAARRPLRQVSEKRLAWSKWIAMNYARADARARGVCEGCGKANLRLEHHHVAGRADQEPWVSVAELIAVLCRDCHRHVTGVIGGGINANLQMRLSRQAVIRLHDRFGTPSSSLLAAIRNLKVNWEYDSRTNRLEAKQ